MLQSANEVRSNDSDRKRSYSHVLSEAKSLSIEKHVLLLLSVGNY